MNWKRKKLVDFPNECVKAYNKWFTNKRDEIRKAEGGSEYNEYIRNLFKGYLSSTNKDFKSGINDEKQKWVTGRLDANYSWTDLKRLALVSYNNLVASKEYSTTSGHTDLIKVADSNETKFLAMLTKVLEAKNPEDSKNQISRRNSTQNIDMPPKGWKLVNTSNAKTCQQKNAKGVTRTWY